MVSISQRIEMQASLSMSDEPTPSEGGAMTQVLTDTDFKDNVFGVPPDKRDGDGDASDLEISLDYQNDASVSVLLRPFLAEFLATLLFVFIGVLSVWAATSSMATRPLEVALTHGLAIFILISVTSHISGGHINPAISLGVFLSGRIGLVRMLIYWMAQLSGGVIGAALVLMVLGHEDMMAIEYGVHNPLHTVPSGGVNDTNVTATLQSIGSGQALGLEMFATCIVVLTVLMTATLDLGPLCIGLAVATGILTIGNQTGGSMNPARSFGPLIVSLNALGDGRFRNETTYFHDIWRNQWIYWLGPFLGALMASLASRFLLAQQKEKRPYMRIKVQ